MNPPTGVQTEAAVTSNTALFTTLHLDNFRPMELCFAILLALATNRWRQRFFSPTRLAEVMRRLRYALKDDPILEEVAQHYGRNVDRQALRLRVQISFWSYVLRIPVQAICGRLRQPSNPPRKQKTRN